MGVKADNEGGDTEGANTTRLGISLGSRISTLSSAQSKQIHLLYSCYMPRDVLNSDGILNS